MQELAALLSGEVAAPTRGQNAQNARAMTGPPRYFDLILLCGVKNAFNHRLRLVAFARQQGIKAAERA